ncbi:MAG TPA: VWA domain-containing protein [Vicinamibacterales bacterium]|nr:VWA domain-containing protein [Vicinamibacterales bacterium]
MRRVTIVLIAAIAALVVRAQATPDDQQPPQSTFRATVRLIVQPVSVKDKQGKPVLGLTAKDFVVTEDGQPQEIAFVEYQALDDTLLAPPVIGGPPPTVPVTPSSNVAAATSATITVPPPGDTRYRGRRLVVLYFDLYQMPFFDQLRVFSDAQRYVATQMAAADLVAIMAFNDGGVRLKREFTDDRAALGATLDELMKAANDEHEGLVADTGGAFGDENDTFNIFSTDRQLAALQTAVTDLGPLPELKTLVYFGSGLRLNGLDNLAQMRATVNAAIRANVTLNPIDSRGLVATPPMGDATRPSPGGLGMFSGTIAQAQITRGQQSQDTLYALAKDTGGRAMFDSNDLSRGIRLAAQAVSGYYLVGYYSKNTTADGKFRRVKVSLATEMAADLSYRAGYYGDKEYRKFTRADKERQLAEALRLEDPITEIPMAMEVNYFQISSAEYFVPISVRMPRSELTRSADRSVSSVQIDMIGEIKDSFGVTMRNMRDQVEIPAAAAPGSNPLIQYETGFTVLPGDYVIKLLARNGTTGRIGTFQAAFTIPNLEREATRLPISSVVLSSQRVAPGEILKEVKQKIPSDKANPLVYDGQKLIPSVTRAFSASRPMFVFLQAYERDATTMRPLAAYVTFYRGGEKVFETDALAITEGWDSKSRAVPIRFTVPLTTLPPGAYDCQVSVLDPTGGRAAFWHTPIVITR